MKTKLVSDLTTRMLAIVSLLHLFLLSFLYFGLGAIVEDGYESQFIDYVRFNTLNFASNLSGADNLEQNINSQAIEEALLNGMALYIQIYNKQNKPIQSVGAISKSSKFIEDFQFQQGDDDIYHIEAPLHDDNGEYLGKLQIGYDETLTIEQIESAYRRALLFCITFVIFAFAFTTFFGRLMTKPIQALRELTKKIAHGKYQTEISVHTRLNEIKSLADTLEFMRNELVRQSESMEHLALHDYLTSLPNRVLLEDRVNQAIANRTQGKEFCVLAVIDLDKFKDINDSFGHITGDNVLKQAARRLVKILRESDTVARLGGDEFAIWLPGTTTAAVISLANQIIHELSQTYDCSGHSVSLGASIGLVNYPQDGKSYIELLQKADIAMYAAKRTGGGIQVYQSNLDVDSLARLTLVSDLRIALKENQFFAVYQPKINIKTHETEGAEVLIRWNHPVRGVIQPNDFIPATERSGMISQITYWVLTEAIRQTAEWQKKGIEIPIAVNLSPNNLIEEGFHKSVIKILKQFNVPAYLLELEITESSFFADPIRAKDVLEQLHSHGIKITIDDFGTGYSSLAQLRKMPVTTLKIDRSFIHHMVEDYSDATIVSATIYMAHELGLKVIAEGVEDKATLEKLKRLNCDSSQGYLIAKPMPGSEFEIWLDNNSKVA